MRIWRAVALLSHVRKVLEKALDPKIRETYCFHPSQCSFRKRHSVETALLHLKNAVRQGARFVCVLYLEQAYASVPRGALVNVLDEKLPSEMAKMARAFQLDTIVETVGDNDATTADMVRGVLEGSPLSPTLFKIYIDVLAAQIAGAADEEIDNPANFFADDVILMAKTAEGMQHMLSMCKMWAAEEGLKWSVSKCTALAASDVDLPLLRKHEVRRARRLLRCTHHRGGRHLRKYVGAHQEGHEPHEADEGGGVTAPHGRQREASTALCVVATPCLGVRDPLNTLGTGS